MVKSISELVSCIHFHENAQVWVKWHEILGFLTWERANSLVERQILIQNELEGYLVLETPTVAMNAMQLVHQFDSEFLSRK